MNEMKAQNARVENSGGKAPAGKGKEAFFLKHD